MKKRSSAAARILAVLALVLAILVVVVVASSALSGSDSTGKHHHKHQAQKHETHRPQAKAYTVKTGDTLTAIAHKTGVPVAEILALNPEVDPQILIAGQTLKLR